MNCKNIATIAIATMGMQPSAIPRLEDDEEDGVSDNRGEFTFVKGE